MFPEMSFVGYVFETKEEIEPFVEPDKGPTFEFCKELATTYSSYVVAGFPRRHDNGTETCVYNSLCLVSPKGELVAIYDKCFLFDTDHIWAKEGAGFITVDIPQWNKRIGLGICMDVNPYEFQDYSLFEFANFHREQNTDILLLCANWLDDGSEHDIAHDNHVYWAQRLQPLHYTDTTFIVCNRIGTEKGTTFCGGSAVISLKHLTCDAALSKRVEQVLIHNMEL